MNNKYLEKEIDYQRDIKNHLLTSFLVTFGGSVGLMFNPNNIIKIILATVGFLLSILLFYGYFKRDDIIVGLLNKLKED